MSLEEDPIDTVEQFAEETAENVAIESEQLSNDLKKSLIDTDGDPCNSYEWSVIFLFVFVMALLAMAMHLWTLFKRRANLSAFDVLFLMLCVCTLIQFGPMLSQVRKFTRVRVLKNLSVECFVSRYNFKRSDIAS